MTTYQAAERILRHCEPQDLAALNASHRKEVAGALSRAVALFFAYAPDVMRRSSASVQLAAPRTITGLPVTEGSVDIPLGSPFTDSERGSTIQIDGDDNRNEITAQNKLLNPYQGATGEVNATVYGDCAPIHSRLINAIVSDPWILLGEDFTRTLRPVMNGGQNPSNYETSEYFYWDYWGNNLQFGTPTHYGTQYSGVSQDSDVYFLLRVHPIPTEKLVIRFEIDLSPDMISDQNIVNTPIDLPLGDSQLESILLPLAEREMVQTTLWKNKDVSPLIFETANRAEALLQKIRPNFQRQKYTKGTPLGW